MILLNEHCIILLSGVLNTQGEWHSPDLTKPFGFGSIVLTDAELHNDKLLATRVRQSLAQLERDTVARLEHEKKLEAKQESKDIPQEN